MSLQRPIRDLEKAKSISQGTTYVASMGDGSGTMQVSQELLEKEVGKGLKIGDLLELMTENKESLVAAINEVIKSGGGSVDILETPEEIEANTEAGKAAGALAMKAMFGELNDKLSGCSLEQEGNDFYIIGADSVRKKLGNSGGNVLILGTGNIVSNNNTLSDVNLNVTKEYDPDYFSSVTNGFQCKQDCTCQLIMASTGSYASDQYHYVDNFYIYQNNTQKLKTTKDSQGISAPGTAVLSLKKGDTITFKSDGYAQTALRAKGFIIVAILR